MHREIKENLGVTNAIATFAVVVPRAQRKTKLRFCGRIKLLGTGAYGEAYLLQPRR